MKVELDLEGYIPAAARIVADIPNDVTEAELDSIREDLVDQEVNYEGR